MAILREGLTIAVGADTSELSAEMRKAERTVEGSTDKMRRSTEGLITRMDRLKVAVEKVKGVALFFTAALTAGAGFALKYGDAMVKLDAANTLASRSTDNLRGKVKAAADEMGITHVAAAGKAREAIVRGYGDAEKAVLAFGRASKLESLGFGGAEDIAAATQRAAKAFDQPIDAVEAFGAKASVAGAGGMAEILNAAVELRPAMDAVGLSLASFAENVAQLRDRGASTGQAIELVTGVIDTFRGRNDEASTALNNLGLSFGGTGLAGSNLATLLASLTQQQNNQKDSVLAAVGGNQQFLDVLAGIGSGGAGGFLTQVGEMNRVVTDLGGTLNAGRSTLDEWKQALLGLQAPLQSIATFLDTVTTRAKQALTAFEGWVNSPAGATLLNILSAPADVASSLGIPGFAFGGSVPGQGNTDSVPAMLTPGEFVVRKEIAEKIAPFLRQLNQGGFKVEDLFSTFLTNTLVGGKHLLSDVLGLRKRPNRGLLPNDPAVLANARQGGQSLNAIARQIFAAINATGFNKGGSVTPSAPGGGNTINATFNTRASSIDEAFIRRKVLPMLERLGDYGQSRRGKSGL